MTKAILQSSEVRSIILAFIFVLGISFTPFLDSSYTRVTKRVISTCQTQDSKSSVKMSDSVDTGSRSLILSLSIKSSTCNKSIKLNKSLV